MSATSAAGRTLPARGSRRFTLIWAAQLVAHVANGLTPFALTIHVYRQTGLSSSVALVTIVGFLPAVALAPLAGVLADRHDRRLLMLLSNALTALGLGLLLVVFAATGGALVPVCLCLALGSASAALLDPAYRAIITDLLAPDQYARAGGMVQLASAAQFLIAPAVAGVLMARADVTTVIALDLGLTVLTAIGMACIPGSGGPTRTGEGPAAWSDLRAGVQFLTAHRGVAALVALATLVTFCIGFLQTLLTPMLLDLTDEQTLGVVRSTAAVGMLVASLAIGMFGLGDRHLRAVAVSLVTAGTVIALIGAATDVVVIGVLAFAFFLALPPLNTGVEVLARSAVPNDIQGKVWGLIGFISQLGYVAAYALSGPLADLVFVPLLGTDGVLAGSVGRVIGTGPSRGIGLMFVIVGVALIAIGSQVPRARGLRSIDEDARRDVP